jgi:hypothetical protein
MRFQRFSEDETRSMYLLAKSGNGGNPSQQATHDLDEIVSKVLTRLDKEDAAEQMVTYESSRDHLSDGHFFTEMMRRLMEGD